MTSWSQRTWFITGTSAGIGQALAEAVLARGGKVVAAVRNVSSMADLEAASGGRLKTIALDVTKPEQVERAVREGEAAFGGIDVLVNNAGAGLLGGVEECTEAEIRANFELNFFGPAAVIRAALPAMRARRSGVFVNVSSLGGLVGSAGSPFYCAAKFALEGMSEALAEETAELGMKVMIVEPGPFRTSFPKGRVTATKEVADYGLVAQRRAGVAAIAGKQPGDPVRAAAAILDAVDSGKPPLRLVLGKVAFELATQAHDRRAKEVATWKATAIGADFPDAGGPGEIWTAPDAKLERS